MPFVVRLACCSSAAGVSAVAKPHVYEAQGPVLNADDVPGERLQHSFQPQHSGSCRGASPFLQLRGCTP